MKAQSKNEETGEPAECSKETSLVPFMGEGDAKGVEEKPIGDEGDARLAEIRRLFEGKAMSYFEMAERALEYHDIYVRREIAQNAEKPRVGRPGVVSRMAEELTFLPGNSKKARLAWLERALKVAKLSPEAVTAAKKAKLDGNRSALIEIAEAGGPQEQMNEVKEITRRKEKEKKEAKKFIRKTVRIPVVNADEIFEKLITFAEEVGASVD